jgi:release factor glutamine methyltransferase
MHVLRTGRTGLLMRASRELEPGEQEAYLALVERRMSREPLQHITGEAWFMGRRFVAAAGALIPRPETECMVEDFASELPARPRRLLDVGTGSGVIAVTLALTHPSCTVVATDASRTALGVAAANARLHGAFNVMLVACDLASALGGPFDGIAANLPYIPSGEMDSLEPEVRRGDPAEALDGGPDGLATVRRLLGQVGALTLPGAVLSLEASGDRVAELAGSLGPDWILLRRGRDLAGQPRWVTAVRGR